MNVRKPVGLSLPFLLLYGSMPQAQGMMSLTVIWIFSYQLTQSKQPRIDMPMGHPNLENPQRLSPQLILDCIKLTLETTHNLANSKFLFT